MLFNLITLSKQCAWLDGESSPAAGTTRFPAVKAVLRRARHTTSRLGGRTLLWLLAVAAHSANYNIHG